MAISEALTAAYISRLILPLVKELYEGSKRAGLRGLKRWDAAAAATKIAKRIKQIDQVRTIWKPEEPISLKDFFHPPKLIIKHSAQRVARLSDLPSNAVVIEGIVGQGKSVFLRSLAIEELIQNDGKWIPMFLELKDITPKLDLMSILHKSLDSYDIDFDDETVDYLFRSGKFALLLDGFDELEDGLVKETHLQIEHLAQKYPELRIVVSSRPGHEILKSTTFQRLRIAPLRPIEYPAFLERLKVDAGKSLAIRQAIKNSPSKISELIITPLMLTLVVLVYESESEIPETLPDFFDRLFQVVFTKHDRQKANFNRKHQSGLSERRLQSLFEAFSFMTIQAGYRRTLTDNQFIECFEMALKFSDGIQCEVEGFRHDITKAACLMLEDGIDSITYLHKSILEYYAAAFVKRLSDNNAEFFYRSAMAKSYSWRETLVFLKAIDTIRYSRYYVIPVIDRDYAEIVIPAKQLEGRELLKFLSEIYGQIGVYYLRDDDDYEISSVRGFKLRSGDEIGDLEGLLMSELFDIAPGNVDDLTEAFGSVDGDVQEDGDIFIPGYLVFNLYGVDRPRKCIDIFEARLEKAKAQAEAIIQTEEKKALLFGGTN
jgi:predicted NACHT family NTPase